MIPVPFHAGVNVEYKDVTPQAVRDIRESGLDHVRIPFNPENFDVGELKGKVLLARQAGLFVIVDGHPRRGNFKTIFYKDRNIQDKYLDTWRLIVKAIPSDGVYFEIMNEPGNKSWWDIQEQFIRELKKYTKATFIASGPGYSTIKSLSGKKPYKINNVIYNFHFYFPMKYTHQGTFWNEEYKDVEGVQYPGEGWDKSRIQTNIYTIRNWAATHNVQVICNEFGAYKQAPNREQYLRDVASTLRDFNVPYTLWNSGGFAAPLKWISE